MALYKVNKPYRDLELGRLLKANDEVEMTVKRAEEVTKSLKDRGHGDDFLERLDNKKAEEKKDEPKKTEEKKAEGE